MEREWPGGEGASIRARWHRVSDCDWAQKSACFSRKRCACAGSRHGSDGRDDRDDRNRRAGGDGGDRTHSGMRGKSEDLERLIELEEELEADSSPQHLRQLGLLAVRIQSTVRTCLLDCRSFVGIVDPLQL